MTTTKIPSLNQYWEKLAAKLPSFSPEEQRAAVALYRELAKGQAVDAAQLSEALGISPAEGRALLARNSIKAFVYPDDQGRVLGFGGLATAPMHHRFEVDGRTLWTWCAWDGLFIPEILGRPACVTSPDPENGEVVRLLVSPDRIESAEPEGAVVSFLLPDAHDFDTSAANVMAKFCHFVFFFTSRSSGERWTAKHPGTFLYSPEEAFALAKRLNARNFGLELARKGPQKPTTRGHDEQGAGNGPIKARYGTQLQKEI
jgi:alkylmercury lyase